MCGWVLLTTQQPNGLAEPDQNNVEASLEPQRPLVMGELIRIDLRTDSDFAVFSELHDQLALTSLERHDALSLCGS